MITHTFATPGIYYVTVTASSDGNPAQSETVTQVVHAPLTANRPAMSSNIVFDGNGGRVWVANQDNNTVSVFNAATNAKLAEVAVGAGPRTLAVAPNGSVWVTNKHAATISVIDPSTLTVSQTVVLPYASQPFGIAFAPTGGFAFVALEAKGALLKLDASVGAILATVERRPQPAARFGDRGRNRCVCLALHHAAAAGRIHGAGVAGGRGRRSCSWCLRTR